MYAVFRNPLAAVLFLALSPALGRAQSDSTAEGPGAAFVLHGVVVDATSGEVLPGVGVRLSTGPAGWTYADGAGRFAIPGVPGAWAELRAEHLGYEELEAEVRPVAGDTLLLRMEADPVEPEALRSVLEALDRRVASNAVVAGRGGIAGADAASVLALATSGGGIQPTPCGRAVRSARELGRTRATGAGSGRTCAVASAGRLVDTSVWIDEERDYGGLEALADLPTDGLWRVEISPWRIRVYTSAFMEWAVMTKYRPGR